MPRPLRKIALDWWDYTALDKEILNDTARLSAQDMLGFSSEGFKVVIYDTLEELYCAEVQAWMQSTFDNPVGVCGPIGLTEQLPLVTRIVNSIGPDLREKDAHFWGMDGVADYGWRVSL